jgi:site-specific DNA-methyltransferase (adenine-specific)
MYPCETCPKTYKWKEGLRKHTPKCTGVSNLQCKVCMKSFKNKHSKHYHKKIKCVPCPPVSNDNDNDNDNSIIQPTTTAPQTTNTLKKNVVSLLDCVVGLKRLHTESVDIIICDPPYNIGKPFGNNSDKQNWDDYLKWCDVWIKECIRVLKPNGTLYIYGFSEKLAYIRTLININVRWLIWHYTNKVNTPSLNFWQRTHESILSCYINTPIFNRDDVREPYSAPYIKHKIGKVRKPVKGRFDEAGTKQSTYKAHEKGALPRDVIKVPTLSGGVGKKEGVGHPTQKPIELCKKLIYASKNKEEPTLLVIPFAGSGSECIAAKEIGGVTFYAFEINEIYVQMSNTRLQNTY